MKWQVLIPYFLGIASFLLFLSFQAQGIYGGDSGDLVTAAVLGGVPHPPGYPFYTFMGWLLAKLPWFTPAWRVGLLSSWPHAASVGLLFLLVIRVTKSVTAGWLASTSLAANYLFFLYSVTPEVFALFDLFVLLLIFLLYQWAQTKNRRYLLVASFVFGLSLTHHQVILFLVPALAYWIGKNIKYRAKIEASKSLILRCIILFLLGLAPYLYIPIAARGSSIINWDRAVDFSGLVRLVTRADYGTFVSGGLYGAFPGERLLGIKAYVQFVFLDFSWWGVSLVILGLIWLYHRDRKLFIFLSLSIFFLGPGFFFYASFPLMNRFTLGTYERFLLPSYLLLFFLVGAGSAQLLVWARAVSPRLWRFPASPNPATSRKAIILWAAIFVLFLFPLTTLGVTVWRFWGLPTDRTAENLGEDILAGLPKGSLLLLSNDTPLFTAQYMRFARGYHPDILVIHANRVESADYRETLRVVFPDLTWPDKPSSPFITEFIRLNLSLKPIFSNTKLPTQAGWFWVPYGLIYQLVEENKLPTVTELMVTNAALLRKLRDPTAGILGRYDHLMLANVRDVYAGARIEYGKILLRARETEAARQQFQAAVELSGDITLPDAYTYLGLSHLFLNQCDAALSAFDQAKRIQLSSPKELTLYQAITLRDCLGDAQKAQTLMDQYEQYRQKEEIPLESK